MKLFKKIIKIWYFPWLVGGIILRLALMPITFHPDLLGHSFTAYFLAYKGVWNIYDYFANLPPTHPLVKNFGVGDIFIYPPLAYFTLGFFRFLVKPFVDANFVPWLMENLSQIHSNPQLFKHLFFFKLPYLFLDIGLAFLLAGLFTNSKKKKLVFILWLFNPVALYVSFMIGQLDLLPTFFTVLSLYLFRKKKVYLSALALGIAASYKMYPLFLLFPLAFLARDKLTEKIKVIITGMLPFVLFILPYFGSSAFRAQVFSPKSQKMLFMGWPVSGAEVVYPFVLILTVIYFVSYYSKEKSDLKNYFLAVLLLIFSVTHYHPQWFLWVTPFLILEMVENDFKNFLAILGLFSCWLVITLLFEASLSYGLFNPLWPQLDNAPSLSFFASRYIDTFQFKSLVRSVFAGISLAFSVMLLRKNKDG